MIAMPAIDKQYILDIRHKLHEYPELAFDLPKTLALVRRALEAMGIPYTEKYGRSSIDWGASAVVGSGTYQIKAIELHKGKPIFYSIANFIFQVDRMTQVPLDYYEKFRVSPD